MAEPSCRDAAPHPASGHPLQPGEGRGEGASASQSARDTTNNTGQGHPMSGNIAGKVVVITGASSGLGEATARLLSAEGASVMLGARRVESAAGVSRSSSHGQTANGVLYF